MKLTPVMMRDYQRSRGLRMALACGEMSLSGSCLLTWNSRSQADYGMNSNTVPQPGSGGLPVFGQFPLSPPKLVVP